ncbi:MAG: hypothetical protein KME13_20345 [Myxacorys californica WJT36-NPBG1]|jgi:hypothetical protein|nr:hypothetical protein [Myxacorys californica WJT36-NPBG1]
MSTITTTGSSLKADNKPGAVLEAALLLDAAEKARNGANPGITPKNNISITFSSDDGTANIAATLPVEVSVGSDGSIAYAPKDYLGGSYATFTAGGDVTATNCMAALVQVAQLLSAAEKAVQPVEDQSNFIQIESSSEAGTITIAAAMPITQTINADGNIVTSALDYL